MASNVFNIAQGRVSHGCYVNCPDVRDTEKLATHANCQLFFSGQVILTGYEGERKGKRMDRNKSCYKTKTKTMTIVDVKSGLGNSNGTKRETQRQRQT